MQRPRGQAARRPAADENGLHVRPRSCGVHETIGELHGLPHHPVHDGRGHRLPRHGEEVAVQALVGAERDVDVEGKGRLRSFQGKREASSDRSPCRRSGPAARGPQERLSLDSVRLSPSTKYWSSPRSDLGAVPGERDRWATIPLRPGAVRDLVVRRNELLLGNEIGGAARPHRGAKPVSRTRVPGNADHALHHVTVDPCRHTGPGEGLPSAG